MTTAYVDFEEVTVGDYLLTGIAEVHGIFIPGTKPIMHGDNSNPGWSDTWEYEVVHTKIHQVYSVETGERIIVSLLTNDELWPLLSIVPTRSRIVESCLCVEQVVNALNARL